MKDRVREVTSRTGGRRIEVIIRELRQYLLSWKGYYGFSQVRSYLKELDSWVRRRLRCYLWKPWGRARLPRAPATWCQSGLGLEYGQVHAWTLAVEPEPGTGVCFTDAILHLLGVTPTVRETDLISRTAVVRDPYARWCGRREVVRPPPIPIRQRNNEAVPSIRLSQVWDHFPFFAGFSLPSSSGLLRPVVPLSRMRNPVSPSSGVATRALGLASRRRGSSHRDCAVS